MPDPQIHLRKLSLPFIMTGAALLRLLLWVGKFGKPGYRHLFRDDQVYWQAAQDLWQSGQIASHKVMPGLPAMEGLWGFPGIVFFNMLCDLGTIWLTYRLALHMWGKKSPAYLAASLVAISPGLLYFANHAYTESLFTFLLILGIWLLYGKHFGAGSLILVLSVLVRPTLDIFNPLCILLFARTVHSFSWQRSAVQVGKYLLLYLLLMAPWWWHNYQKYDRFVRLHLGGGEVMYHGQVNLPQLENLDDPAVYDLAPFVDIEDPFARQGAMQDSVIAYWTAAPSHFPQAVGLNFLKFWLGTPEVFYGPFAYLVSLWQHAGLLLGLLAIVWGRWWRQTAWWPWLLLLLYFSAVHSLLHGMPRYRLPLEPFIWTLAAGYVSSSLKQRT